MTVLPSTADADVDPSLGAIAVVGMGLVVPGASSPDAFWDLLHQPTHALTGPGFYDPAPMLRAGREGSIDGTRGPAAGFIGAFPPHPQLARELSQGQWTGAPPEVARLRHSAMTALEGVRVKADDRVAQVFGGWAGSSQSMEDTLIVDTVARRSAHLVSADEPERLSHERRIREALTCHYPFACARPSDALPENIVQMALSGLLPTEGRSRIVDSASASSLYALEVAVLQLEDSDAEVAVIGGLNSVGRTGMVQLSAFQGLTPSGRVRPFDAAADGTAFAEATAVVVLKQLGRALTDGDTVHGLLRATGTASDGSGLNISAPNPRGQRLAVQRALNVAGLTPRDVGWVISHGGASPVGDRTELSAFRDAWGSTPLKITSNKGQCGHGCWASGMVSLIHALLGLRHGAVPAMRRFGTEIDTPGAENRYVRVPVTDGPWNPGRDNTPTVGVSSIGLGGANAHALLSPAGSDLAHNRSAQRSSGATHGLVLVGWGTALPGLPDRASAAEWLRSGNPQPQTAFAEGKPAPPFSALRLPPTTVRSIDRTHIMALAAAGELVAEHGELWEGRQAETAVFGAYSGPPPRLVGSVLRAASTGLAAVPLAPEHAAAVAEVLERNRADCPVTEESMAGLLPGVAAARIANRWNLQGPTMSFSGGPDAGQDALDTAVRYLDSGRVELALVLGTATGGTAESACFVERPAAELADGACLLALTTAPLAESNGWTVVAELARPVPPGAQPEVQPFADYLAAAPVLGALRAALGGDVRRPPGPPGPPSAPLRQPEDHSELSANLRVALVHRLSARVPRSGTAVRLGALPPGAVVLTSSARTAAEVTPRVRARGALLLTTDPATKPPDGTAITALPADDSDLTPGLGSVLDTLVHQAPHVRVLVPLAEWADEPLPPEVPGRLSRLQELLMLVLRRLGPRMEAENGSLALVVQDPWTGGRPHPLGALFTGMIRSLAWEIAQERVLGLVTDAPLGTALTQLSEELDSVRDRPVVQYLGGLRHTEHLVSAPLTDRTEPDDGQAIVSGTSVVVAAGGARGITAVCLRGLAERFRPRIWLLGTTPVTDVPDEILDAADEDEGRLRPAAIAAGLRAGDGASVGELSKRFSVQWQAREVTRTLRDLKAMCGPDRVHYLVCDLTDQQAVCRAIDTVHARDGRIDLLIHAATRSKPAPYQHKTTTAFRQVVDTKAGGYLNLRSALADRLPRWWCNFGSDVTMFGVPGDPDYVGANEFLATAAQYTSTVLGEQQFTVGWGLWNESGFASGTLEQDRIKRFGLKTGLSDTAGVRALMAELSLPRSPEAAPLWTTPSERAVAEQRSPGIERTHVPGTLQSPSAEVLLGPPELRSASQLQWTWNTDRQRDRHLGDHLLEGRPLLAGMMIVAMAVEAAGALLPRSFPTGFRSIRFSEYVWADPHSPGPSKYRITARETAAGRVRVRILSDVTTPGGHILRRDREHARIDVLTGTRPAQPAEPARQPAGTAQGFLDPTAGTNAVLRLFGPFRNTYDIAVDDQSVHARWLAQLGRDELFTQLPVPVLLLDALVRCSFFVPDRSGPATIRVLRGIDSLDLYEWGPDSYLAQHHTSGIDLRCDNVTMDCTATADGLVIARIQGLDGPAHSRFPALPRPPGRPRAKTAVPRRNP